MGHFSLTDKIKLFNDALDDKEDIREGLQVKIRNRNLPWKIRHTLIERLRQLGVQIQKLEGKIKKHQMMRERRNS